ncbi:MAG: outer membrane protein [Candidatus Sulfotelmatobacter sp.]
MKGDLVKPALAFWLFASSFLLAQQEPSLEIFAGYSLENVSPCGTSADVFPICKFEPQPFPSAANYNGWNASLTVFAYKSLGVTADFGGHYGTTNSLPSAPVSRYSFMFGPVVAMRRQRVSPFAHALFGGVTNTSLDFSSPGFPDVLTNPGYTKFAWAIGGGVDAKVARRWAVRIAQFDFERIRLPSPVNGFRVSAGVVFKP